MKNLKAKVLAITVAVGFISSSFGQARPMPPDPYDPKPASSEPQTAPPVYPAANDFPSVEVQAIPPARARLVELRWTMEHARRALMSTVEKIREDFEASSELQASVRSQAMAHDRFVTARDAALAEVRKDARYTTLRSMADDLKDRIDQLQHDDPKGHAGEIRGFAELRLDYSTKATAMETDALIADARFQQARERLVEAATRTHELRNTFNRSVRRNTEFVAAKNLLTNLNIAYLTSDAYLRSALDARNVALTYAYSLHRYDQYRYAAAYPYYDSYRVTSPYAYNVGYARGGYGYPGNRR